MINHLINTMQVYSLQKNILRSDDASAMVDTARG